MTVMPTASEPIVADRENVARPAKFAHVVLRTSRYQQMLDWYRMVLNATTTFADEHIGFVTYDDEHHRVAFVHIPGLADQPDGVAGVHHYAFTYATLSDLLSTYERLKAVGIMPIVTINHGPTVSFYYEDPDRNQVELQVDAYETIEESAKFFHTEQFATNPIGVDVSPEDLRRRLDAGEPEAELKLRPHSGPRLIDSIKLR